MPRRFCSLLICILALLTIGTAAHAERRVALVIGNATYQNTPSLANALNDAEDMVAALKRVGFEVIFARDGTKRAMEQAIVQFARAARESDAALFYYAGHALQFRGQNYLMPVDAKLEDELSLNFEMTRLDDVLNGLEQSRGVKILILDSCRNNPLADRLMSRATSRDFIATRGLARIDRSQGMVVVYATQPNQVANDGIGRNSPFTAALVKRMDQPGVEIGTLFRRVAADVFNATGGRQQPELSVSLLGEFYFTAADSDVAAWAKVRTSQQPDELRQFISRYGSSPLAIDARDRLASLERDQMLARERQLREQLAQEQAAREKLVQEQIERERLAQEQAARERLALEQQRLAQEEAARQRLAQEEAARQRLAQQQTPPDRTPQQTALLTPPATSPAPAAPALAGEALAKAIQSELKRVGCYAGPLNGDGTSAQLRSSLKRFAEHTKVATAVDDLTFDLLNSLRSVTGRVCPLHCSPRQIERDGACVAKQCPAGSRLNAKGVCDKPDRTKTAARPPSNNPAAAPAGPKAGPKGKATRGECFSAVRRGPSRFFGPAFGAAVRRCMQNGPSAI